MYREKVTERLNSKFNDMNIAKAMENSIHHFAVKEAKEKNIVDNIDNKGFYILYTDRLRSIWNNLENKNSTLLKNIKEGSIDVEKVGIISHQEMNPAHWKLLIEAKIEREKNTYENNKEGASKEFKCMRCKKRETKYTQVQTRSADEPMTTFVTCINCGNNWKC